VTVSRDPAEMNRASESKPKLCFNAHRRARLRNGVSLPKSEQEKPVSMGPNGTSHDDERAGKRKRLGVIVKRVRAGASQNKGATRKKAGHRTVPGSSPESFSWGGLQRKSSGLGGGGSSKKGVLGCNYFETRRRKKAHQLDRCYRIGSDTLHGHLLNRSGGASKEEK